MFRKYILGLASALALALGACSQKGLGQGQAEELQVPLARQYSNDLSQDEQLDEKINSLRYYICEQGVVRFVSPDLASDAHSAQTIQIDKKYVTPTGKIYVMANGELAGDVERLLVIGTAESVFSSLATTQSDDNGRVQALAMGAVGELSAYQNGGVIPLKLQRNMARFDLSIQQGVGIEVLSVEVVGLETAGAVFGGGSVTSQNTARYVSDFAAPQTQSIGGLFYGHPSVDGRAAVVSIDVMYAGRLATLKAVLHPIIGNSIRVISVNSNMGVLSLDVSMGALQAGDNDNPNLNTMSLRIDRAKSQLPVGASVSDDGLRLNMPYWGETAIIALDAPEGLIFKGASEQVDNFTIAAVTNSPRGPEYRITTDKNRRTNGEKKAILLTFSHPNDKLGNDLRLSVVMDNYAPFPAVAMGNVDWMHANTRGQDPKLYQQFFNGTNVRTMYGQAAMWSTFASRSYQWGPRPGKNGVQIALNPLGPEFSYTNTDLPALNGAITGTPTVWTGANVPCPAGWRLPTYAEFASIWPSNNTTVPIDATPIQYTINGKQYTAVIETFGGSYHSNITGSGIAAGSSQMARNLIISDGQDQILFPICGFRKPNGTFKHDPNGATQFNNYGLGVGAEAYYWCGDKSAAKFVAVGISNQKIENHQNNREHNAWYSVRCVRDKK